jgi:enoyl-CoA hydratase/carnithine racemase
METTAGGSSLPFETIIYERRGRTVCITLNRPEKLNAINHAMIRELGAAYRTAEDDPEVWTLIVTGAGDRALCSGADVDTVDQEHPGMDTRGEALLGSFWQWDASQEATPPYLEMAKPIVCAVNGLAAGAGLDLVTTSDIVIASTSATFFDPHVSIGLVSAREAVRLARVLPVNVAMRVALMGKQERLSAQRAYDLGLVTELVDPEDLVERAWEIAELVNRNAPLAVRGTRLGIRKGMALPVYEAELLAESYRLRVAHTDDAREGPRAFLEKRDPVWKAR